MPARCWRVCGRCRPAKACSTGVQGIDAQMADPARPPILALPGRFAILCHWLHAMIASRMCSGPSRQEPAGELPPWNRPNERAATTPIMRTPTPTAMT